MKISKSNYNRLENSRKVLKEEAIKYQEEYKMEMFMETSAKSGQNVVDLFKIAAQVLYDDHVKFKRLSNSGTLNAIGSRPSIVEKDMLKINISKADSSATDCKCWKCYIFFNKILYIIYFLFLRWN